MNDQTKIVDKVRKLLRLSEAANIHEAENAAAAAQRLIEAHRLSEAVIGDPWSEAADDGEPQPQQPPPVDPHVTRATLGEHGARSPWRWRLAWAVCNHNGCQPWRLGSREGHRTVAYGTETDLAVAAALYAYLEIEIDRLADKHASGRGRAYKGAFRLGAIDSIDDRLEEGTGSAREEARTVAKQRADTGDTTALARVETAIATIDARAGRAVSYMQGRGMAYRRGRSTRVSSAGGYSSGRRVGGSIDLAGGGRLR